MNGQHFSNAKRWVLSTHNFISSKNIFQGKGIIKTFSNEGKLKEFVTSKTYSKRIARGNS